MATTNASNQDQDAVVQALCKRVDELTDQNKSMHDSITRLQSQNHSQPSVGPVNQATNPPYDVGYAYAPPWTIHFYRGGNDSASGSQGLAPGPPHKEAVANQPTSSDANSAALNTTVNANDELVKTGPEAIGASKDNNVPQQTPSHGLRRLPTIDEEIEPWLVPGPLTNPVTNYPLFMTIRAVPKAFHGHFNFGHQGPAEEVSGHWEFFSEGPESAEALAHTNLGGQGNWTPNDIVRPTADDVHELRQRLRAERKDDITANIHLTWVTDQTLSKEDRDKLRNRYASQGQKVHGTVHGRTSVVSDKPDTASGKPDTVNKESHAGSKHDGAKKLREDTRWQEELITEENTKDAGTNVSEKNVIPQGDKPLSRPVTRAQSAPSIDTSKIKRAESVARPSTQTHPTEKKRPSTSKAKRPPKPPARFNNLYDESLASTNLSAVSDLPPAPKAPSFTPVNSQTTIDRDESTQNKRSSSEAGLDDPSQPSRAPKSVRQAQEDLRRALSGRNKDKGDEDQEPDDDDDEGIDDVDDAGELDQAKDTKKGDGQAGRERGRK